jgi:hypothetical protein
MTQTSSLPKCGFATFATQAEAEAYLIALDGYSGHTTKLKGGNWGVSFRRDPK